ncbi:MAG: class I SAM-dependent methyltransferase [Candidatus Bathyarchaeia archaeon]
MEQQFEQTLTSVYDFTLVLPEVTWTHRWLYEILEQIPIETNSLIDVGCGRGIIGALARIYRNPKRLVGVDVFRPYLNFCSCHSLYDELYNHDLTKTPLFFRDKEFDVATCIEVLEHIPKSDGEKLLNELERIAKKVIITTPNGLLPQKPLDGNPFQRHVSYWSVKDFTKRGYTVKGVGYFTIFGRKLRYISFLLSRFSYAIPTCSDALLAYKQCNERTQNNNFHFKQQKF